MADSWERFTGLVCFRGIGLRHVQDVETGLGVFEWVL